LLKPIAERGEQDPILRIILGRRHQHPDPSHAARLLPTRDEGPSGNSTAEKRDEFAAFHSMTSSARASNIGGTARPIALAVARLMTSSNLVDCVTGKSAGFAPLRMRPV